MSPNHGFHPFLRGLKGWLGTVHSPSPHERRCGHCTLGGPGVRWRGPAPSQLPVAPAVAASVVTTLAWSLLPPVPPHSYTSANALGAVVPQRCLCWSLGAWGSPVEAVSLQEARPSTGRSVRSWESPSGRLEYSSKDPCSPGSEFLLHEASLCSRPLLHIVDRSLFCFLCHLA